MISILSSEIIQNEVQPDGRIAIREAHSLDTGVLYYVYYLAEPNDDTQQRMLDRVEQLLVDLNPADDETVSEDQPIDGEILSEGGASSGVSLDPVLDAQSPALDIVSSKIIQDDPQPDGRRVIREAHTLSDGSIYYVYYLAEPNDDVEIRMSDRVTELSEVSSG